MFCQNCGNELKDGAKFCGKCGAKIETMYCRNCGTKNEDGAKFCCNCGSAMGSTPNERYQEQRQNRKQERWQDELLREAGAIQQGRGVSAGASGRGAYSKKKNTATIVAVVAIAATACVVIALLVSGVFSPKTGEVQPSEAQSADDISLGDIVTFGAYEQDNDTSNGKEEIEWLVLDKKDGKALLISKYILDCQPYNEEDEEITWEDCTLREWLNEDFMGDAFSEAEKNMIALSEIKNDDNPEYGTDGGDDTEDKIFLLSIDEAEKYFGSDDDRIAKLTDYGIERCIEEKTELIEADYDWEYTGNAVKQRAREEILEARADNDGCWYWLLRSPANVSNGAACVLANGVSYGGSYVDYTLCGIRPAMWVNLES